MRATGAGFFPVVLLFLLAALTFWLERATQTDDDGRNGKNRHDPDYIVDNFHVRRFDVDGKLQHTLVAQKMLHYPDDDSTKVVLPRLTYHRSPPAHVNSNLAWLDKDGKHVKLDGDVHVIRESLDGSPYTEITTSVLYAVPDDEFAHTEAPVVITQGQTVINGTGLETNNKTQISVLFGRVNGIIYKKPANQAQPTHENKPTTLRTPAVSAAGQPARPAAGVRRKGRQGQAGQSRSRPHNGR